MRAKHRWGLRYGAWRLSRLLRAKKTTTPDKLEWALNQIGRETVKINGKDVGWKTIAAGISIALVTGAHAMGLVDEETFKILLGLLNGAGLVSLRLGVARNGA